LHKSTLLIYLWLGLAVPICIAPGAAAEPHASQAAPKPEPARPEPPHPDSPPALSNFRAAEEALDRTRATVADAADAVNAASGRLGLLLFGGLLIAAVQIGVLVVQILVLYRSIAIVEAAAASRNRPRLVVRHANLEIYEIGRLAKVHWVVENMGNADGTILEAYATLITVQRGMLPAIPQYDQRNHAIGGLKIEVGRTLAFVQFSQDNVASSEYDAVYRGETRVVFLYGYLVYEDALKVRRRVGFCRMFDQASGRFTVFDDPNYDYAD
jgi:hypothetical protein